MKLPIPPNQSSLKLLLRARSILSHAHEHSGQNSDFDNMVAILGLDNTIEYILRIVASHLDLESITGKSFDIIELSSLASSVNKALIEHFDTNLPYLAEIKLLRQTRNLVQHGAVAPHADLERFSTIVDRFFDKVLTNIFGLPTDELKISDVIKNKIVQKFLKESEDRFKRKEWLESIVSARNAFENAIFDKLNHFHGSLAIIPAIIQARKKNDISSHTWDAVKNEIELSHLGINTTEYRHFENYMNHIPKEHNAEDVWGNTVMQRPWKKEDATFCYNFAANTILRWQYKEKDRLYPLNLRDKYEHKEIVAGISLSNGVDPGCFYSYEGNESVELLWVNKDKKRRFEKLKTNKPYVYRTIMYKNGEKEVDNKKIIEFIKIETFIAVNNPEKWRVILWYKDIK
jgi:hypothetical protein